LSMVLGFSLIDFEYKVEDGNEHVVKGSTTWKQEVLAMVILSLSLSLSGVLPQLQLLVSSSID
jgi:hypothetical protein